MSIDIGYYIKINSHVIGANSIPGPKLVARVFTPSRLVPAGTVLTFATAAEVEKYFTQGDGLSALNINTTVQRAKQYFGYNSPLGTSPQEIQIARWVDAAQNSIVFGGTAQKAVANFAGNGSVNFTVAGAPFSAALTFSGVVALADVATQVQAAIRAALPAGNSAAVTYNVLTNRFVLDLGPNLAGDVLFNETPLAVNLGWYGAQGVKPAGYVMSPSSAAETPVAAVARVNDTNSNFGRLLFANEVNTAGQLAIPTLAQAADVSQWVSTFGGRYGVTWGMSDAPSGRSPVVWHAALAAIKCTALALGPYEDLPLAASIYTTTKTSFVDIVAATQSAATDFANGRNVSPNYMYRDMGIPAYVKDTRTAKIYDALLTNYIGEAESNGVRRVFYQRGVMLGDATAITDEAVFTGEQWLRGAVISALFGAQLSLNRIPANRDGAGIIDGLIRSSVIGSQSTQGTALYNGVILAGKELSILQQIAITTETGDPKAWRQVQSTGFYLKVTISPVVNPDSGIQEYQCNYTLVYAKGDSVKTIVGNHALV